MAGNSKMLAIVLIVTLVVGLLATGGWAAHEGIQLYKRKSIPYSGMSSAHGRLPGSKPGSVAQTSVGAALGAPPLTQTNAASTRPAALDPLAAGRMRSNRATGYDTDLSNSCMNENLVGAIQAPLSDRAGNMRPSFPSAPVGSKPVPLGSTKIGAKTGHGSLGRTSAVDLTAFARMGMDRAIGAQGLDDPAELALASVMLGHLESADNTSLISTDPRGEAVGSWQVGYSTTSTGIREPGAGTFLCSVCVVVQLLTIIYRGSDTDARSVRNGAASYRNAVLSGDKKSESCVVVAILLCYFS